MKILRKFYSSLLLTACLAAGAHALPEGAVITNGSVNINTNGSTQTITQSSNKAIINWNGFNIDVGELVNFVQPSSISAILNRVVGQDPSVILGSLRANGQVFLINPNGVVFGETANVDVGSLVVSTLNITDDDFLQGNLTFQQEADEELASVINHGRISVDDNGFLVLTGPMVANEGVILAKVGQVALAAGTKSTVSFDPTGMIQVALPEGSQSNSGIVSLSQSATSDLLASVAGSGASPAGQLVNRDGKTFLEVASGTVVNTGEIRADASSGQTAGRVILDSTAHTLLADGSVVSAAGNGENSHGGEIFVLSDGQSTSALGSLIDVSAGDSGNAGFAEQSGLWGSVSASLDLAAPNGEAGTFLIDPVRILVESGAGTGPGDATLMRVSENFIEGTSAGTVMLEADNGVEFEALTDSDLDLVNDLNLMSGVNLLINLIGGGDLQPAVTFQNPGTVIQLQGAGNFTLASTTGTNVEHLQVQAQTGNIDLDLNGGNIIGDSGFSSSTGQTTIVNTGNVGSALNPVEITGNFSPNVTGDVFIDGVGDVTLITSSSNSLTATGSNFLIQNPGRGNANRAASFFDFNVTGNIDGGILEAPTITIVADMVGDNSLVGLDFQNLNLTANQIFADAPAFAFAPDEIRITNLSPTGVTEILDPSTEATLLFHDTSDGTFVTESEATLVEYTTVGDIGLSLVDTSGAVTVSTDGAIGGGGGIFAVGDLTLTGSSINLNVEGADQIATFDGTATAGDVSFVYSGLTTPPTLVSGSASSGDVTFSTSTHALNVGPTSGINVALTGTSVTANDVNASNSITATSSSGNVTVNSTGTSPVTFTGTGALGSGNVTLTAAGDVNTAGVIGDSVDLSTTSGNINRTQARIIGNTRVDLSAPGGVDVLTTTDNLDVTSNGNVTVDNLLNSGFRLGATVSTTGDIFLNTDGELNAFSGGRSLTGDNINITADEIDARVNANSVDFTANDGDVFIDSDGDITVSGSATSPGSEFFGTSVTVFSQGDIVVGAAGINSITAPVEGPAGPSLISLNARGPADSSISGSGALTADFVDLTANGSIQANTDGVGFIFAVADDGSINLINQNSPSVNVLLAGLGTGDVSLTSDGFIEIDKAFAQDGDITVTSSTSGILATRDPSTVMIGEGLTVPGNTIAALNGSVTLQATEATEGPAIEANVTTGGSGSQDLMATADGDIIINGVEGGTIDVDIESTMGSVTFSETGTVTGDFNASDVSITANVIGVTLGTTVANLNTTSLGGDITAVGNSANLDITSDSSMGGSVDFQNNGGGITAGTGIVADNITLTATGALSTTGLLQATSGFVDLQGTEVTATVETTSLIADATAGNVDVTGMNSPALAVSGSASGEFRVVNSGSITTDQITANSVFLDAQGAGNGIARTSGNIAASTVELRSGDTLQAVTQGVTTLTADALGDVDIQNSGSTITAGLITAPNVTLLNDGGISGTFAVTSTGTVDLTSTGGAIDTTGRIEGASVALDAVGVNVLTTTDSLNIISSGAVVVDNDMNMTNTLELDISAPGQSVTVVSETDLTGPSFRGASVTGDIVNLTAPDIDAEITANTFLFNATDGDLFASLNGPTTVSGMANNSTESTEVIVVSNDNITIGAAGINAGTNDSLVLIDNIFQGTISGPGLVQADAVEFYSDGVQANLGGVGSVFALLENTATGNITLTNSGATAVDILLVNRGSGDVSYSGGDSINVEKLFAAQGDIFLQSPGSTIQATTDPSTITVGEGFNPPGNTISAPNGSVTIEGASVTANVTTAGTGTSDLTVDATGDIAISGVEGGTIDVDIQSTMGTVSFSEFGLVTGVFSGNSGATTDVTISGNTIDVNLGNDVDTLATTSTGGNVTAVGNNASLTVTSANPQGGAVNFQNNGGDLELVTGQGLDASSVTLTATGDITESGVINVGTGTVDLQGANVTAQIQAGELIADATNGDVDATLLTLGPTIVGGSASGEYRATHFTGGIRTNQITADSIFLNAASLVPDLPTPQNNITRNSGFLTASDIELRSAGSVQAETQGVNTLVVSAKDDVEVSNTGSNITGGSISTRGFQGRQGPAAPADVILTNTGGIGDSSSPTTGFSVTANGDATITSTGGGVVDILAAVEGNLELSGGSVNVDNTLSTNLTTTSTTGDTTINSTAPGTVDITATSARDLSIGSNNNNINIVDATAVRNAVINAGTGTVSQVGTITGDSVAVTASVVDVTVDANSATATATSGDATVRGSSSTNPLTVSGSAVGEFFATSPGGLNHGNINASTIVLDGGRNGGSVGRSGTSLLTATNQVTLTGANINAGTNAPVIDAQAPGDVTIENQSNSVDGVVVVAGQDASFTTPGTAVISQFEGQNLTLDVGQSITGDFNGGTVNFSGTDIDVTVQANQISATARTGDANIASSGSNTLTVTNSSAAGDFDLSHGGNVEFDRIEAQNVTITTSGDITDTANTIVASGITLNGNNVFVNTEGQIIVINAQGNVTVSNSTVDVDSLTIDAQGNVSFDTDGNLTIAQVAGGQLVELTVGGNIFAEPNAFVSATDVSLTVGGAITPDLNNPLDVLASNTINVTAPGASFVGQGGGIGDIAAALTGSIPASSVFIGSGSGPIYYNGVLLNPNISPSEPVPPVVPPINDVVDQLGQQNGQVIDDGSVGSAANDGLVEQSPTQQLVAQLTENAEGGGQTTAALLTLDIDAMGDVQVKLEQPSPYDESIDNSDDMRADDILDLETGELVEVKVAVYYDATNDQLVMAVDLRADDIIDLDVEEYGLIPLNLEYSFLADPNLLVEKLRADDLIDLEVEDLGNIPIRVHVEGNDPSAQ